MVFNVFTSDDYHPGGCNGPGDCIHCDRKVLGLPIEDHIPETCLLCKKKIVVYVIRYGNYFPCEIDSIHWRKRLAEERLKSLVLSVSDVTWHIEEVELR